MDVRISKIQPRTHEHIWRKARSGKNKVIDEEVQVYIKFVEENVF